jgi:hypothetical protein
MKRRTLLILAACAGLAVAVAAAGAATSVKPYVVAVGSQYEVNALFSVNDRVPEASNAGLRYRMVGIPDGLGAHPNGDGTSTLYMNHELTSGTSSSPVVDTAGTPVGFAYRGALVSKWTLDANGNPIKGERAYDVIYNENTLVGPAPDAGNSTRAFSRFCSGALGGPEHGFDRHIYFTNEEEGTPANSFDGKGGLAVAIFDNALYTLPKAGRFAWENTVPQRGTPKHATVLMSLEDGPAALDQAVENSQVYMYVGARDLNPGATPLRRNGLDNGQLYVLAPVDPAKSSEATFTSGQIPVKWVPIPNAGNLDEAQLEAASDAIGAFRFARPEDGAFNPRNRNNFLFVTTGGAADVNELGRVYSLDLNPNGPTKNGYLKIEYAADDVIAAGGDIAISPDNVDASGKFFMINEDGTTESRAVMASKGRDGSIWRFETKHQGIDVHTATRVAELDPPGWDGAAVGPGVWETSGIIDASALFGANWWLSDVQAHSPTAAPAAGTVEDGQLFLLRPKT